MSFSIPRTNSIPSIGLGLGLVPLAFAGLAAAQTSGPLPPPESESGGPPIPLRYDLATHSIQFSTAAAASGPSNELLTLDNEDFAGFSQGVTGPSRRIVDSGRTVGSNGPVCEFSIAYSSGIPDAAAAGVVAIEIVFYKGDAATIGDCIGANYGGSGVGEEVASFVLAGLPGDTTPGDGMRSSWLIETDLRGLADGGFMLPEGGVSWGYRIPLGFSDSNILLVHPGAPTCTPPAANPAPGTGDCFDSYEVNFAGVASCVFTTTQPPGNISSTWMKIIQAELPASAATLRDNGTQSAQLTPVVDVAVVGCVGAGCPSAAVSSAGSALDFWFLSRTSAPGIPIGVDGDLLIGLPEITSFFGAPGATLQVPGIPIACDLVGVDVFTQGGAIDSAGGIALTNAVDYVIGTP